MSSVFDNGKYQLKTDCVCERLCVYVSVRACVCVCGFVRECVCICVCVCGWVGELSTNDTYYPIDSEEINLALDKLLISFSLEICSDALK